MMLNIKNESAHGMVSLGGGRLALSAGVRYSFQCCSRVTYLLTYLFSHRRQVFPAPKRKHATTECVCGSPVYIGPLSILRFSL